MKKLIHKKQKRGNHKVQVAAVGVGATAGAASLLYFFWCKRHDLKNRAKEWKNARIRNAFYDTLEQKDVAWG